MPSSAESDYPQPNSAAAADATPNEAAPSAAPVGGAPTHPSNAPGEEVFPLADSGEYYVGLWNGHPKYGCPVCAYTWLPTGGDAKEGDFRVASHIQEKSASSPKHAALGGKEDNA